ncbi:MAG: ParA family protein [Cyclobacteriaceae bacterium]
MIVSISNHKGGVGKTSSSVNLAAGVSLQGKKTLLVDLDPQANASQSLNVRDYEPNIYHAMKGEIKLPEIQVLENLWLVPSGLALSGAELEFSMEPGRENILKELLLKAKEKYDYIFIDCPPSLGLLTLNALNASDFVLVPLQAHYLASQGLQKLLEVIAKVQTRLNPGLQISGILITMYRKRTVLSRDIHDFINTRFADLVYKTKIRDSIAIAEAPATGQDIFRYAGNSLAALDYSNLVMEFLNRHPVKRMKAC